MAINYQQLKTELQTDPLSLGYGAAIAAGNSTAVAALINQVRPSIQINRRAVSVEDFLEAIDPTEYAGLTQTQLLRLILLTQQPIVPIRGAQVRQLIRDIFPNGGPTRNSMVALRTRTGSRAEELFGEGESVSSTDVSVALAT